MYRSFVEINKYYEFNDDKEIINFIVEKLKNYYYNVLNSYEESQLELEKKFEEFEKIYKAHINNQNLKSNNFDEYVRNRFRAFINMEISESKLIDNKKIQELIHKVISETELRVSDIWLKEIRVIDP